MSEFEIEWDEPTVVIGEHTITLIMDGFAEFDRHKRITRIVERLGQGQFKDVCPIKSQPLYDALHKLLSEDGVYQFQMDEIIDEQLGHRGPHRSSAWVYSLA
jgi:hypothetical protein